MEMKMNAFVIYAIYSRMQLYNGHDKMYSLEILYGKKDSCEHFHYPLSNFSDLLIWILDDNDNNLIIIKKKKKKKKKNDNDSNTNNNNTNNNVWLPLDVCGSVCVIVCIKAQHSSGKGAPACTCPITYAKHKHRGKKYTPKL